MKQDVVAARTYEPLTWTALAAFALFAIFFVPIGHDQIWQLWLGREMLHGRGLYTDLVEVNPPLWFWIAVPQVALSELAGGAVPLRYMVAPFFIVSIALSLYLIPARYRLPALAVFAFVPINSFGQREHFTLIASAPYVFAIAARSRGIQPRHAAWVGLFAAVGLCLKPHFLLLPAALELLVLKQKRFRPETITLAAFVLAYAISIPLFAPAYLTEMLPMIRRFYSSFWQPPDYFAAAVSLILATAGAWLGRRKGSPTTRALLVAALAFVPTVLLQAKGFSYHSVPVRGFLCLAIILELLRSRRDKLGDFMLVLAAVLCCYPPTFYRNVFRAQMEQHLANATGSIIVLATNPSAAWPMVEDHGLKWELNAFSAWQVNAVVYDPSLLPEVQRMVAPSLARKPDTLILDNRLLVGPVAHQLLPKGYLRCYRLKHRTAWMESYVRVC